MPPGAVAPMVAVRRGAYKSILCPADPPQLFNLDADPLELTNLAGQHAVHSGTLSDRAAFLRHVARPCTVAQLAAEDVRIRLFGTTAIVHGRTTYLTPDRQCGAGRYTDVWAHADGAWLCVAADVTRC